VSDEQATDEAADYGRVGYGSFARWSPFALAVVMIVAVAWIALHRSEKHVLTRDLIGKPAPALMFTMNDGREVSLDSLRGQVVVLNFWASWCEPCVREMPAFQAIAAEQLAGVQIIGVNLKNDQDDAAAALLASTGVTYSITKDSGGSGVFQGTIEEAFGSPGQYPMTIVIAPDGTVDSAHVGELTGEQIRQAIDRARS
jgi:cytochrome c biogenesis protein CcmG/thiol:disulfide interchange protein DsbE